MKKFIIISMFIFLIILISVFLDSKHKKINKSYTPDFIGLSLNQYIPAKITCGIHYVFDHYGYCSTHNILVLIDINTMKVAQVYLTPEYSITVGDYILEHGIPDSYTVYCNAYWLFWKKNKVLAAVAIVDYFRPTSLIHKFVLAEEQLYPENIHAWQGFKTN